MQLTFAQRLSRLWAAALTLESAAIRSLEHLPPAQKKKLEHELKLFRKTISLIKKRS